MAPTPPPAARKHNASPECRFGFSSRDAKIATTIQLNGKTTTLKNRSQILLSCCPFLKKPFILNFDV